MGRTFLIVIAALSFFSAMATRPGAHGSSTRASDRLESHSRTTSATPTSVTSDAATADGSSVELQRSSDGHFYADVEINGTPVHMLIDTGASGVALSRDDARSAGIATSIGMPDVVGQGADGAVHGEIVRVQRMRLGPANAEDVPAVILNSGGMSLLGQDFLQRFASVEIRDDRMVLR